MKTIFLWNSRKLILVKTIILWFYAISEATLGFQGARIYLPTGDDSQLIGRHGPIRDSTVGVSNSCCVAKRSGVETSSYISIPWYILILGTSHSQSSFLSLSSSLDLAMIPKIRFISWEDPHNIYKYLILGQKSWQVWNYWSADSWRNWPQVSRHCDIWWSKTKAP